VRTRSALLVLAGERRVLVDPGPDLAAQLERLGDPRVDAVLVTHTHMDHVLGLDDLLHLRPVEAPPLPVHAAPHHRRRIRSIFPHLVRPGRRRIVFRDWRAGTRLRLPGLSLEGFETGHRAEFPTTAVLFHRGERRIAYQSDMGALPAASRALLAGVDLFVGDGTYPGTTGYGHPGTDEVLRVAREVGARRVALTHLGHAGLHRGALASLLGTDVHLCRDGDDLAALVPDPGQE
jgi:phosphoribosyl 1,2-cyclic phosphate phosphodiesterase